jgi:pyruvate/2-oxoacid:ferredoxin oxidoreductase alpha subunit
VKAGFLRLSLFRPFPTGGLREVLGQAKEVLVIDRDTSLGAEGILAQEVKSALFGRGERTRVTGFIAGIGGRDITPELVVDLASQVGSNRVRAEAVGESRWVEVMG